MEQYKHTFAICAIIKDEPDIFEWISHYQLLGFEHIFIYDNNSTISLKTLLAPLEFVTVHDWDGDQRTAYCEYVHRYRKECKWTFFVDGDEYLVFRKPNATLDTLVSSVPEKTNAIGVHWLMFDANGHYGEESPKGLTTEIYTNRAFAVSDAIKSIVRTDKVFRMGPHHPLGSRYQYNVVGEHFKGPGCKTERKQEILDFVCLHHYHTRSLAHWKRRLIRGKPNNNAPRTLEEFWRKQNHGRRADDKFLIESGWTEKLAAKIQFLKQQCE